LQTSGVLVELRGADANLPIGRMLTATIPAQSSAAPGVLVPRGALLREDSKVWVYVQTAPESFMRREVVGYVPEPDGWFVREGFTPGDRVVATGAAVLLAVESPAEAAD
jgi:membrane fusion protein, heavy metal efflux system